MSIFYIFLSQINVVSRICLVMLSCLQRVIERISKMMAMSQFCKNMCTVIMAVVTAVTIIVLILSQSYGGLEYELKLFLVA